ncbi:MAG: hypothetical protein GWN99_14190 [Gemmatimonadetes bacterium]|uniref:RanBP2-type domain-containing protein n=1 Tax=Candidatus Kutchimonas denitrificans TaxID=3056748 RepID=A0AAE4ZAD8_9BACT|nr:hypothetical protein [Candidatus Kutchimonas denitrificans]NIS02195.1 hypothetical protein [Gemmatimonadota bacterium]NIV24650.1 hypothetical protein [Gemmatimonadota bacterium]NIW76605.1 hypothetical protein [Gemmatimonadota bacterium]
MADDVQREVDGLLKEREKYEAFIKRLESEKATTTERAYARVRGDYARRLREVEEKLGAHGNSLQGKLRQLSSKVSQLEARREQQAEELDEAQLRRNVGEYPDDKEWSELESRMLTSLRETERDLESARSEIGRLQEIVASVQGAEAPPPQPGAAPPPPQQPAPQQPQPQPSAPPQPQPAPPPPPPEPAEEEGFLSLEELVLEDKDPEEALTGAGSAEPPDSDPFAGTDLDPFAESDEPESSGEGDVTDELAFLESLSLGGGGGEEEGETSFSFLEQHGSGTPQTIICPHCSAANEPAEWYCTECGEELPAE